MGPIADGVVDAGEAEQAHAIPRAQPDLQIGHQASEQRVHAATQFAVGDDVESGKKSLPGGTACGVLHQLGGPLSQGWSVGVAGQYGGNHLCQPDVRSLQRGGDHVIGLGIGELQVHGT
ncbi:hypothetical protein A5674_22800 [Mycobacterium malmoense]|uniref:hypothetical protein n=1 Tax=Mycobacterium malmoense TaxID=1780 RepID=UPI00080B36F3|nr:hypothetical protein [Mycobacterium malmoense]OCB24383.1 hypothetical protein A5674_22800 [Mycobacterium malmoense]